MSKACIFLLEQLKLIIDQFCNLFTTNKTILLKEKKLGYVIKEGSNTYKSNTMKFVTSRNKRVMTMGSC